MASINNGDDINTKEIKLIKSAQLKIKPVKTAPKNVLPTSPMKTLDGYQFKIRNPKTAPDNGRIEISFINAAEINIIIKHPPTKPSIPSIKFAKFITAVPAIIRNK